MPATVADLTRKLVAARLDEIGPGGGRWTWRHDAVLIHAVLHGQHLARAVKATGYVPRRCFARIRKLMPPVPHAEAKHALLSELRARAAAERKTDP